jgi:hypothetical protein
LQPKERLAAKEKENNIKRKKNIKKLFKFDILVGE